MECTRALIPSPLAIFLPEHVTSGYAAESQVAGLEMPLQTTDCHEESKVARRRRLAPILEPWSKEVETAIAASAPPQNPTGIPVRQTVQRAAPRNHERHLTG